MSFLNNSVILEQFVNLKQSINYILKICYFITTPFKTNVRTTQQVCYSKNSSATLEELRHFLGNRSFTNFINLVCFCYIFLIRYFIKE